MTDDLVAAGAFIPPRPREGRRSPPARWIALLGCLGALLAAGPTTARAQQKPPEIDARAWLLLDARDGEALAAHRPNRPLPIASATKLMTAHLALEELELGEKLAAPAYDPAPAESVLGLQAGERMTVRDLIVALLLASANDAAVTIADGVSGSTRAFVAAMNRAAERLELDSTTYANPIGLDDPLNRSSAADLATLALELRTDERFRRIVAKPRARLRSGSRTRTVTTRNSLLLEDPSVDGIKTGHTLGAGYVLVASAERRGVELVSVVLGAGSEGARDAETSKLLDYGYSLYERERPVRRGEELARAEVRFGEPDLPLTAGGSIAVSAREGQSVETSIESPAQVEGPIERGERLGTATVTLDGERVGRAPLLAARSVPEPALLDRFGDPAAVGLIVGGLIVILIGVVAARRRGDGGRGAPERTAQQRMESRRRRAERKDQGRVAS